MKPEKEALRRAFYPDLEQGTEAWLALRKQCLLTASELGSVVGRGGMSRAKLLRIKLGLEPPEPENAYMRFGKENEAFVISLYEDAFRTQTEIFGFATIEFEGHVLGASPDRVVRDSSGAIVRLIEVKCSVSKERTEPQESHLLQMLLQSVCMGVRTVDYVCWAPCQVADGYYYLNVGRYTFPEKLPGFVEEKIREYANCLVKGTPCMVSRQDQAKACKLLADVVNQQMIY